MQAKVRIAQPRATAKAVPHATRDLRKRIVDAQVESMFAMVRPTLLVGFLSACLVGAVLYWLYAIALWRLEVWIALHFAHLIVRAQISRLYWRATPEQRSLSHFGPIFACETFLLGLTWGLGCTWLLAPQEREAELLMLIVVAAYASGTVVALGSYLPAHFAHFAPLCIPIIVDAARYNDTFHKAFVVLGIGYMFAMGALSWASNRNLRNTLRLDIEKGELIESLRAQNELVEQASRAKSRFLASASHDLRQPVHALGMFVGALREQPLNAQSERLLDQVTGSIDAMDSLFASLLDISKLDAGVVKPAVQNFKVGPIIERVCGAFAIDAERKGLALTDSYSSLAVRTDPVLLESILRNLISNAVRYTDKGRILVGCRRGERVRIEVFDTGRGIAEPDIERIFEEFYQVGNPERDRSQGLGLGLAIVKRVSALIDCQLEIHSEPHRGTRVTVRVPIADGEPTPDEQPLPEIDDSMDERTVFVVDDEASIRAGMESLLKSWGYRVFVADSGQSILELAAELPVRPDLIICDFRLRNGENGLILMNRLRTEYNSKIPGMLITGDTAPDRLAEALRSDYLIMHKPISSAKLRAAIRAVIARAQADEDDLMDADL